MIFNENLNVQYGKEFGINFFLNNTEPSRNNYTMNNIVVNCWDLEATKKVFSVEHEYFNNNYHEVLNGSNQHHVIHKTVENDINTTKKLVYYITFEKIPFQIVSPEGKMYEDTLSNEFVDNILEHVKEILDHYTNAQLILTSNLLKYRTQKGFNNDLFIKKIYDSFLNTPYDDRLTYRDFDLNILNSFDYLCVFSNKVSYLFAHCNSKGVPVVIKHNVEDKFAVYDDYMNNKFNKITDTEFKVYVNDEFLLEPIDVDNHTFTIDPKYTIQKKRVEKLIIEETTSNKKYQKLFLHADANILKSLFDTDENRSIVNILDNPEDVDENTLIVTLNNKSYYNNLLRKNHDKFYNWLGFDFDILKDDANETSMRYYMQSFGNIKPMYSFSTADEITSKFNITEVKDIALNTQGDILLCLDYPVGINYTSLNKWYEYWNNVISKVKAKFNNKIIIKSYFDDKNRKLKTKEIYQQFFSEDQYITYDDSSESFLDVLKKDNIYFCIKCQGALFLKCFMNGKILLNGLPAEDILKKPDKSFFMNIEKSLNDVVNGTINLNDIATNYNNDRFNILNTTTKNLTTIDDIKNGTFVNKIIKN